MLTTQCAHIPPLMTGILEWIPAFGKEDREFAMMQYPRLRSLWDPLMQLAASGCIFTRSSLAMGSAQRAEPWALDRATPRWAQSSECASRAPSFCTSFNGDGNLTRRSCWWLPESPDGRRWPSPKSIDSVPATYPLPALGVVKVRTCMSKATHESSSISNVIQGNISTARCL